MLLYSNTAIYANDQNGSPGTVGGFFKLPNDDAVYGITNFHLVQSGGQATQDSPVFKGGSTARIGELEAWYSPDVTVTNYFDLALFSLDPEVERSWTGTVTGFADANDVQDLQLNLGNGVVHYGFAGGVQQGPFPMNIAGVIYSFANLLQIQSVSTSYQFSIPGNSGSLIMAGDKIVALLVAGDPNNPFISYGIPFIDRISNKGILNYVPLTIA